MGAVSVNGLSIQEAFEQKCAESRERYARALELFPGGATRSARGFATWPLSIDRASGSRIWDADGNEYIDYYVGLGSTILGHAHPLIVEAIQAQLERGTQYGLAHDAENQWAGLVAELVPSCERIRFTNSGLGIDLYRHPACARVHRARENSEVRGALPRLVRLRDGRNVGAV